MRLVLALTILLCVFPRPSILASCLDSNIFINFSGTDGSLVTLSSLSNCVQGLAGWSWVKSGDLSSGNYYSNAGSNGLAAMNYCTGTTTNGQTGLFLNFTNEPSIAQFIFPPSTNYLVSYGFWMKHNIPDSTVYSQDWCWIAGKANNYVNPLITSFGSGSHIVFEGGGYPGTPTGNGYNIPTNQWHWFSVLWNGSGINYPGYGSSGQIMIFDTNLVVKNAIIQSSGSVNVGFPNNLNIGASAQHYTFSNGIFIAGIIVDMNANPKWPLYPPTGPPDPVDQSRLPFGGTWSGIVGVSNGIPNRSTVYTNFTASATIGQINTGIANCPSNQVVHLASGSYTVSGANLLIANNGVTVRGDVDGNGNPTTILVFDSTHLGIMDSGQDWNFDNSAEFTNIAISSGANRSSTAVTLASTPTGLTAGTLMVITAPRTAPVIDGGLFSWFPSTDDHPFSQGVKVTGVSGTTVSFWPAINADYIGYLSCIAHYRPFSKQLTLSGIENIQFTNTTGFFNDDIIRMRGNEECWLKNCWLYGVGQGSNPNAGISLYCSFGCELRHNKIQNCAAFGSSEYGMISFQSWSLLVEDNIWFTLPNLWPQVGTSGSVFSYNYFTNEPYVTPAFLSQIVLSHGAHDCYDLFEGNWIPTHFNDLTASGNLSHSRNMTYFRENLPGWDGNGPKTSNAHCISFQAHHDNATAADNYMGHAGTQTQYEQTTGGVGGVNSIFNYDSAVSGTTLQRFGNWNIVDGGIHSGEGLSGGQAFVNSYIYSSKPTYFASLTWPPNPSAATATLTDPTNIPAGFRFTFGSDPSTNSTIITSSMSLNSATMQLNGATMQISQ